MSRPVIVFAGDSVTDVDRRTDPDGLGHGYVRLLTADAALHGRRLVNRGIAGDRVRDLRARWADDVLAEHPDVVSVLIGVNDTWRRFDADDPTSAADYGRDLRALLEAAAAHGAALVLVEPFLLPVTPDQAAWRDDLEEKISVVHALADEYGATLVAADRELNALGRPAALAPDGVHPSAEGHAILARLWRDAVVGTLTEAQPA